MSDGLNSVTLIGNLGADPELRYTQAGAAVMNCRLAVSESYLDKDKVRHERTEWVSCTIWGKRAEGLAKILTKGDRVCMVGALRTDSYEDKEGIKRYRTEVVVREVVLCGGGKNHNAPIRSDSSGSGKVHDAIPEDDYGDDYGGSF